jgi:hypothetical protein
MIFDKDKLFLVLDETGHNVEYTIEVPSDEDVYFMRRSRSGSWSENVKGELILTVLDSGDGFRFKWQEGKNKVLDYAQTIELNIMLNFLNDTSRMPNRYSIVDAEMIVDLV